MLTKAATTTSGGAIFTETTGLELRMGTQGSTATWLCPHATINTACSWGATGDTIFVSNDHAETSGAAATCAVLQNQIVISVSRTSTNFPPLAANITTGAQLTTTGAFGITFTSATGAWVEGLTLNTGTGTTAASLTIANRAPSLTTTYRNCTFKLVNTGATATINVHDGTGGGHIIWDGCAASFAATGQSITHNQGTAWLWRNSPSALLGTMPTTLFVTGGGVYTEFRGVDFNALGSNRLVDMSGVSSNTRWYLSDCKIAAATTFGDSVNPLPRVELINCGATTNYNNQWRLGYGVVTTETTIVRTGGATDGTQAVSHKFVSNSACTKFNPLEGPSLYLWNTGTGSQTATVEIVSSGSLTNNDIWLDIEYLSTAGVPLSINANNSAATVLTTAANQTSSSTTWVSSPATPVNQKLQVTFTAATVGIIRGIVKVGKATATIYVDPVITLS